MGAHLYTHGICKSYEGAPVIADISIALAKGELVSLLGVSGIGKTTLFQILSGLEQPDSGEVWLNDTDVTGKSGRVGYMQQKDLLLPFRTIIENVCIPLRLKGMSPSSAASVAQPLFEEFGLVGSEQKYPAQLSGGMRQRAALLRTYLFSGELLLLDEPFSALDAITKASMHQWFRSITQRHGTSALLITHDMDEAILLSDRIYVMSGIPGRITAEVLVERHSDEGDFAMSEGFLAQKRKLLALLK